jgi:hypothetical protein
MMRSILLSLLLALAHAGLMQPADAQTRDGRVQNPDARLPGELPQADIPAFPGAEGGGMHAFGGRGGRVYVVTSLDDSGPGTFREALEAEEPRIVVFNVAGIIRLQSPVNIDHPYITIAGQTAPGDGVCIAGETVDINTHDVVIRYMRFRRGATDHARRDDALGGDPIGNIMIDHCSFSWGLDENISLYRRLYPSPHSPRRFVGPTLNMTIQWSISSEGLDPYNHAFGATWGGRNSLFHHNLFASNTARNPSIGMGYEFNFVNNVLFNWQHRTMDGGDHRTRGNAINNYYKPGPATNRGSVRHRIVGVNGNPDRVDPQLQRFGRWYVQGNVVDGNEEVTRDNWAGGVQVGGRPVTEGRLMEIIRSPDPFPMARVTIHTAERAYELILEHGGASLPRRDAVDERIMHEVRSGEVTYAEGNGIITDISQVGGHPEYRGESDPDLGPDGIPGWWKQRFGLDEDDPELAAKDLNGDGYTVIEAYINGLDPTRFIDWRNPRYNVNTLREPDNTLVRRSR